MSLDIFHNIVTAHQKAHPLLAKYSGAELAQKWQALVQSKSQSATPVIMVYGVYNAGKSTLINALVGRELAKVADRPQTDRVDAYTWQGFQILDTPGIDAPIAHENVTRDQLDRSDVVLFVLGSSGVAEEMESYHSIVELVQRRRQTMIVINNKTGVESGSANEYDLIDKIRRNLQRAAEHRGVQDVLKSVPIVIVNAQSALKAKLDNKQNLLKNSKLPELEKKLLDFLRKSNAHHILQSLASELESAARQSLDALARQEQAAPQRNLDSIRTKLGRERQILAQELRRRAAQHARSAKSQLQDALLQAKEPQDSEKAVERIIDSLQPSLSQDIDETLRVSSQRIAEYAKDLELGMAERGLGRIEGENLPHAPQIDATGGIDTAMAKQLVDMLQHLGKDHIVTALSAAKELLPALFKGIGPKSMGKIATTVMQKVPFVGSVITLLIGLWEIYQASEREKQQREAQERFLQAVADAAQQFGESLQEHLDDYFVLCIDEAFKPSQLKLEELRQGLDQQSQELSADKQKLEEFLALAQSEQAIPESI